MMAMMSPVLAFVCPQCRLPVQADAQAYRCVPCERSYPVLFGIPDFRLRSDRYLGLEQDRAKAARLADAARTRSFEQLLDFYYEITDDVAPQLAVRYKAAQLNAVRHMEPLAADLAAATAPIAGAIALDAGCGAGGLLIASHRKGVSIVGVDIALRWLVICRKRLDELGVQVPLVCADLADPPFLPETFAAIAAVDLVEHVPDVRQMLASLAALAQPSAPLWITAANGRTLGPHPSTRLWAIGWFPAAARNWLLRMLRGVDALRFAQLLTPGDLRRIAAQAGLIVTEARPRRLAAPDRRYPVADRVLMQLYRWLARTPVMDRLLLHLGPSFEIVLRRERHS